MYAVGMKTVADLPALHTRRLLKAFRVVRAQQHSMLRILHEVLASRGVHDMADPGWLGSTVPAYLLGGTYEELSTVTVGQLKAELAGRPHVPNKQESRELRRRRALKGSSRGKRDR